MSELENALNQRVFFNRATGTAAALATLSPLMEMVQTKMQSGGQNPWICKTGAVC